MTDKQKEQIAIFRFGVIFPLLEKKGLAWGDQKKILQQLSQREWEIPFSERTTIGGPTILNWLKRYREGGEKIEALFPSDRSDCGRARSISDETFAALLQIRKEKPSFTIKKVVDEAYKRNVITRAERVALSTGAVQQSLKDRGITYLKGDWTNRDREIGDYLRGFGRDGLPFYAFYPAAGQEPEVLPPVLSESLLLSTFSGAATP